MDDSEPTRRAAPTVVYVATDATSTATPFDVTAAVAALLAGRRSNPPRAVGVDVAADAESDRGAAAGRRARRLREIAGPGQTVVSASAAAILDEAVPAGFVLRDRGIHRLRDLSSPQRVFELVVATTEDDGDDGDHGDGEPTPLRSLDAYPNNLPVELSSFVGRDRELTEIRSLLVRDRLVTIAGSGGCGKSRLAAHVAATAIERWRDGVWWVDLQQASEASGVAASVATAIGALVVPTGVAARSVAAQLRDRQALLCLDNCEHVVDAVADLAAMIVTTCPDVTLLATSREPLGVAGESIWRLATLPDDEAVELG